MNKIVKNETARKIGLIYSISILIGTVIGVGIFLKNGFVFEVNKGNYIGIIVAWIIAAIISLTAAWSFGEVGSCTSGKGGVGYWIKKLLNKKVGRFINTIQPFFYYTIISCSISIFASETFFRIFDFDRNIHIAAIIGFGFLIFLFFSTLNFISFNVSKKIQVTLSSLKTIPILIVIVMGIFYAINQPSSSIINNNNNGSTFSFTSVIISLPSILFAFDSFTGVGNLSTDIKNPKRNVPLTIIIGMSLVVVVYLLITISLMLTGNGNALNIFDSYNFLDNTGKKALNIIFALFLFISIVGVVNGFSSITISSWQNLIDDNLIYNSQKINAYVEKRFSKRNVKYVSGYMLNLFASFFLFVVIAIPSIIKNTDAYIDGFSNFPTTLFFGIYGLAILGGLINRFNKKHTVHKITGFYITAPIAIAGCLFVLAFQMFYTFSFRNIFESNISSDWGLFYSKGEFVSVWEASILFWVYLLIIPIVYFLNRWLIKKTKKSSSKIKESEIIWNAIDYNNQFINNDLIEKKNIREKEIRRFNE